MTKFKMADGDVFKTTAVMGSKSYEHFGIMTSLRTLYGVEEKNIMTISFAIHDNQCPEEIVNIETPDYWGFYDGNRFTLIYAKRFLLDMCFPAGIVGSENAGHGKAYRLKILEGKLA